MEKFTVFARIAEVEFSEIVISSQDLGVKLRIYLTDKSFIDFFYTTRLESQRFSMHWERNHVDRTIYRIDNTPDKKWNKVKSFPVHFHNKNYDSVTIPPFELKKANLEGTLRNFLTFAQTLLNE